MDRSQNQEPFPQAGVDDFFEKEGIKWGTVSAWSKVYGIAVHAINARIDDTSACEGKVADGRLCKFYPEPEVDKACAKLRSTSNDGGESCW